MRDIYRTSFYLGKEKKHPNILTIIKDINEWIKNIGDLPNSLQIKGNFSNIKESEKESLEHKLITSKNQQLLTVILTNPDKKNTALGWRTTIAAESNKEKTIVEIKLANGRLDKKTAPSKIRSVRPQIIQELIEKYGAHLDYELTTLPQSLGIKQIDDFANKIVFDPKRKLPIVLISKDKEEKTNLSPSEMARILAGTTHTFVADKWAARNFFNNYGESYGTFNGGIRIIWPTSEEDIWNPIFLPKYLSKNKRGVKKKIFNQIAEASTRTTFGTTYLEIRSKMRKIEREKYEKNQDWKELAESYDEENIRLKEIIEEKEKIIKTLEKEKNNLTTRIESLEDRIIPKTNNTDEGKIILISNVTDAIEKIRELYSENIEIMSRVDRNTNNSNRFKKPRVVFNALEWLATTYRGLHIGEISGNFKESCKKQTGMDYRCKQSEKTMGMFKKDYEIEIKGKKILLEEHLAHGKNRDPKYSIRIAFHYDKNEKKTYVGYIGTHQRNRKT